jgi:FkbM family methyltransferase
MAAARKTLSYLADEESRRLFMEHARRNISYTKLSVPTDAGAMVPLRITELGDVTIHCRSGLSDLGVVYDTFDGRFHLPPEDLGDVRTILDLGSNIGLTIAHMAAKYPEARILGVELDRGNYELASRNIAAFGDRCQLNNAAVWHEPGEIHYGGVRESGYAIMTGEAEPATHTAPAVTVDQLIEQLGVDEIDYVKMDIEGAEKEVLAAAGSWLGKVRCIKVEVHPEKASTLYTLGNCADDLERHGLKPEVDPRHHACILARR